MQLTRRFVDVKAGEMLIVRSLKSDEVVEVSALAMGSDGVFFMVVKAKASKYSVAK